MTDYTISYGNTLAVRIMLVVLMIFISVFCSYITAKTIYSAEQSDDGNINIFCGISGIIADLVIAIILIVCGVL